MSEKTDQLTHLVYEASLDNSLWPELILELTEQLQLAGDKRLPEDEAGSVLDMASHFRRAFSISERMVGLQEREAHLTAVLDSFAFGLAMVDNDGKSIFANRTFETNGTLASLLKGDGRGLLTCVETEARHGLPHWIAATNKSEVPRNLRIEGGKGQSPSSVMVLPRREAVRMGFPAKAAAVLLAPEAGQGDGLRAFSAAHGLTTRESELVGALAHTGDLRAAAVSVGLSYESARTYMKRVYDKSGCRGQVDLTQAITRSPLSVLRERRQSGEEEYGVRRLLTLADGRTLEYFVLGPEDGDVVLHFDALAGITIDLVGNPSGCLPHLERHNIRLITPCRPGGFRSSPHPMDSLRGFAPDVEELMDQLGIARASLCSVSFGAGSALAVAHELQHRIDRVVMSAATYPAYRHPDWRELDLFYQMSGILARKWPGMLRQIIPFLVRSIMQNVDRYFDRTALKAKSQHDIENLGYPFVRRRMAEMLAERTAAGMDGMVEENLLNARGWDFKPQNIHVPVEIFHGALDIVSPFQAAEMLVSHLPDARLTLLPDRGHYHHITGWPWLIALAAGRDVKVESEAYRVPALALR